MQHYAQNANNSILCQISALHCETTTATALPTTPAANRFEMQRRCRSRALPIKRVAGRERTARREPRDSCVCALLFTRFGVAEQKCTLAQTSGSHHGIITGSLGPDRACCDPHAVAATISRRTIERSRRLRTWSPRPRRQSSRPLPVATTRSCVTPPPVAATHAWSTRHVRLATTRDQSSRHLHRNDPHAVAVT